jgi:hypothetical protein
MLVLAFSTVVQLYIFIVRKNAPDSGTSSTQTGGVALPVNEKSVGVGTFPGAPVVQIEGLHEQV